jgi:hypothetical protein
MSMATSSPGFRACQCRTRARKQDFLQSGHAANPSRVPPRFQPRNAVDDVDRQIEPVHLVQNGQLEGSADAALLLVATHMHVFVVGATVSQFVDQGRVPVEVKNNCLSVVNNESKSRSVSPCGCSVAGWRLNRSTTLMKRIFKSGNFSRRIAVAARASRVTASPALAITTSGSLPWSVWPRARS